jgi:cytochrome c peroxidase
MALGLFVVSGGCGNPDASSDKGDDVEVVGSALEGAANAAGFGESVHTSGSIDRGNPFFQALGTNPRTCETCHAPGQGWTITAAFATSQFLQTGGLAPLFNLVDTGSRPDADISTSQARLATWKESMLQRASVRFLRTANPNAEFTVTDVHDASGFSTVTSFFAFRRPSPTANQSKVPSTGWNGSPPAAGGGVPAAVLATGAGAARLHEQRVDPLPTGTPEAMRDLQMGVIFAQSFDFRAGRLDAGGAKGGPANLLAQPFYDGINDIQGNDPMGLPFTRKVFDLFDAWKPASGHGGSSGPDGSDGSSATGSNSGEGSSSLASAARAAIYRGQEIFNNREFDISGVNGLNDLLGQPTVRGTCSTCHNAPNVGAHSVVRFFDVGTADAPNCGAALPLLTVQNKVTLETRQVCDLGRATGTTTGKWSDIGAFRAPPLRGLAARPPYFHDGQAPDLRRVIEYFNRRFHIALADGEKRDLEAFLRAL